MNIVITGASSGIGRELVLILSGMTDNRIIAIARNEKAIKSLADAAAQRNIAGIVCDITGPESSLRGLKNSINVHFRHIDILINNAGYLVNKPFEDHSREEIDATMAVNFTGTAALICALLPMLRRGSHVVNISSMGGYQGSVKFPGLSYYSASKAALAVLTECLAAEYSDRGIAFNCLCLGAAETEMFRKAFPGNIAPVTAEKMASYIADFAVTGSQFFNGKILPVALSVP